jgi:hypothetical protein
VSKYALEAAEFEGDLPELPPWKIWGAV